jgi:hypothetical protein
MRRAHPVAAVVEEAAGQNGGRASEPELPGDGVGGALGLADVEPVLEQMGKRSDTKALPASAQE